MRAFWSALDAAAAPVSTLITLAVLVRNLSASDYGILIIALAASGISMAVNPAIAATTTKFISELSDQQRPSGRTVAGVITASLIAVGVIDLALILGTALFSKPLSQWVFGPIVGRDQHLASVLLMAVLAIAIQQIETVLAGAIRGRERFKLQAVIEVISRALLTLAVTYAAYRTKSIESILYTQCAVNLGSTIVRAAALRRLLPNRKLFELSGRSGASALLRYAGWMWLTALAGVAYTSADRIIIGRSIGPAAAGHYNIYIQLTQLIHFIPSSVFAYSFPVLSRLAADDHARNGRIEKAYRNYLFAISTAGLGIAAITMAAWPVLLHILAGPGTAGSRLGAPGLLILNFFLLACNVAPYYLLLALGYARTVAVITTASMLVALVLMALLIPRYGLEGAGLGRLAYGIGTMLLLLKARRLLIRP